MTLRDYSHRHHEYRLLFAMVASLFLLAGTPAAAEAPEVVINPAGGSYTAATTINVRVSILFFDPDGLNAATREVRLWNGSTSVAVTLAWATGSGGTRGTLTGEITLKTAGDNILKAQINDALGTTGFGQATFKLARPPASNGAPTLSLAPHHNEYRMAQGALVLGYAGPAYTSMDVVRAAGLVYNSEHAHPTALFQVDASPELATRSQFVALSLRLESEVRNADGTYPLIGRESFYKVHPTGSQRLAAFMQLTGVSNGPRKYWAVVRAYRGDRTYTETRQKIRALVINGAGSRYGAGWSLAGVQRIYANELGAMIHEGDGIVRWFQKNSTTGLYETPDGDFSALVYDAAAAKWIRTYPEGGKLTFSQNGLLQTAEDRFGRTTVYHWQDPLDPSPVLSRIVDPVGKETTFTYSPTTRYLYSISAAGRTAFFHYEGKNLVFIEGARNLRLTYHPGTHLVATHTTSYGADDGGVMQEVAYDAHNRVSTVTEMLVTANGLLHRPVTQHRSFESVLVLGPTVGTSLDNLANPVDSTAVEAKVIDPEGHETRVSVDRYGNPVKVVSGGITNTSTYNADGLPEIVSLDNGLDVRTHAWSATGQLLQTVVYSGATEHGAITYAAAYNSRNLPAQETSGTSTTWYTYGDRGQLLRSWYGKQSDSTRTGTSYEYNTRYQVIRVTDPKGGKTEWSFEGNAWRNADWVKTIREDGTVATTSFGYDGYGRQQTVTDALNYTVAFTYDATDRLLTITDSKPRTTTYTYTGAFLTSVKDPKGLTYELGYNAIGWLEWERFPDGRQRYYGYDRDGQIRYKRDRNNKEVWYSYDSAHRLYDRWADGVTATFRHTDRGTVMTNDESMVTTQMLPDINALDKVSVTLAGRVFELKKYRVAANGWRDEGTDINVYLNGTKVRTDSIRYNVNSNPAEPERGSTYTIQDPSGRTTVLAFDTAGRHMETAFPIGVRQLNSFTSDGRLYKTQYLPSAVNQKLGALFEYDLMGRLGSRINGLADTMLAYGYDFAGRLTTYSRFTSFEPTPCDRTTRDDCPEPSWVHAATTTYAYNNSDNRSDRGATLEASSNRYATFDGFTLGYDFEGNLLTKYKAGVLDQRLTWSSLGQLTSVNTNGTVVSYGYDAGGRRVRRTENGASTYFLYDDDDLVMEVDANGNPLRTYTHLPGTDKPVSLRSSATGQDFYYYYTLEHPGHVRGLLNVNGAVAGEYRYSPYGEVELNTANVNQPLRYMGRELDSRSGLYYVRNRWYDPVMGRFISEDPIGLEGGLNPYAYAYNDPINMRDPSGLSPDPILLDPVITGCERLWSWGWGDCYSDHIFDSWAEQRRQQDQLRSCDPRSNEAHIMQINGTWAEHYNSAPCRAGRELLRAERARREADHAADAAARQARRRASREDCRAQPRPAPRRLTAYFHEAKWDAGLVLAGVAAGAILGPGIVIGGVAGIALDLAVGAIVEVEGNRIMDRCGPGVF